MGTFWSVFLYVFWIFAFVAFLMVLFTVLVDLFRDHHLNGWWKALWVIFLVFFPVLGVLVYLIARGRGMAERNLARQATVPEDDSWGQHPTASATPAADIQQAQTLLDQGVISTGEFNALRAKALGERY
ncbi:PLDc N-terminal domain-containing protein [Leifsonia virtsii]|uniref:PLDc N-terminal domain-containing protein n=1 Tax=Leifsonia virtsii TaxID=3035915 RepID=A0ABT8J1J9_9MICO|nr:PLDc N-terminal domain-containing protein [Leifsonia virtsii]MDN4598930.1 PLDc N-terminal domain-containing protein [Leifsonia virtsii]